MICTLDIQMGDEISYCLCKGSKRPKTLMLNSYLHKPLDRLVRMDRNTTRRPFVLGSREATRLSRLLARPLLPLSAPQYPRRFCWPRFLSGRSVVEELPPMLLWNDS